jgi:hypothetical protein
MENMPFLMLQMEFKNRGAHRHGALPSSGIGSFEQTFAQDRLSSFAPQLHRSHAASRHRGVISLKSKEGLGTVVIIKLPLRFAEAEEMIKESGDMP